MTDVLENGNIAGCIFKPMENKLQMQPSKSNFMFKGSSYYLNDKNIEQPVTIRKYRSITNQHT